MKAFRFSLQLVLDMRKRQKDSAEEHFAEGAREHAAREDHLRVSRIELERGLDCLSETRSGNLPISMQQGFWQHIEDQKRRVAELVDVVQRSAAELERRRLLLVEAQRNHSLLEQLRDEKLAEHRREITRKEERTADEFITSRTSLAQMEPAI